MAIWQTMAEKEVEAARMSEAQLEAAVIAQSENDDETEREMLESCKYFKVERFGAVEGAQEYRRKLVALWIEGQVRPALPKPVPVAPPKPAPKFCGRGHELNGENLILDSLGHRLCRTCARARMERSNANRKARDARRKAMLTEKDVMAR